MRKNKGYTLVELMVAVAVLLLVMAEVGALMINSQTLYKNGYYEVALQENAQQVVQTVQDLLMNANVVNSLSSTTVTSPGGIKSDIITFQTNERKKTGDTYTGTYVEVTYKIGRRTDLVSGTVVRNGKVGEYTDLVLVRTAEGKETVSTIAEGVQSIYLTRNNDIDDTAGDDMFNVKTADVVSISMNMVNENYRYSAAGEIYLRNKIGTGGDPMPDGGSGSAADVDVTVLRVHHYFLTQFIPSEFNAGFAFKDSSSGMYWDLNETTGEIFCKSNLNSEWKWDKECEVLASSSSGDTYKIKVWTPPVNDGNRMPIYTWSNTTAGMINAIPVNGICTCEQCTFGDLVMDAQITLHMTGPNRKIDSSGTPKDVDLCVLATNGENGFTVRRHRDEPGGDETEKIGTAPAAWNFTSEFDNEVFARVRNDTPIDIKSMYFSICPMEENEDSTDEHDIWELDSTKTYQYRNLQYKYLLYGKGNPGDPYAAPGISGGQHCMTVPHPDSTGANCFAKFTLGRIHVDNKANGFSVNTTDHADASSYYWDYMVSNQSYIRLHIWCVFKPWKDEYSAHNYDHIYDCYGYFFPQSTGNKTQHDWLMNIVTQTPPAEDIQLPKKPGEDEYPYEYYDMNH